jgi:hypothetical protein
MTPRVEAALGTYTLTLEEHTDKFFATPMPTVTYPDQPPPTLRVLLTNGFVIPDTIEVTDPNGDIVDLEAAADIDHLRGCLNLTTWIRGSYSVFYEAGFEPEAEPAILPSGYVSDQRVLQEIPEWMKAIVIGYLTTWYRVAYMSPKAPKDLSFGALSDALSRELYSRVYSNYQRPRLGMVFADRRTYGA